MNRPDKPKTSAYRITLRFAAAGVPEVIRLRRFLKLAWRAYGLRAVKVEEVPIGEPAGRPAAAEERPG